MEFDSLGLSTADYAIIVLMFAMSSSIGVYFKFFGGTQKNEDDFFLAGKDMPILPVAFSLMATFMSAINMMGIPAEMYIYGANLPFMNVGICTGIVLISYVFLPMYFSGNVSSVYEYLEGRFGKTARLLCSLAFILQMILYTAVVLYAPALALSAVTNLSTWASVITLGVICIFYCTLGGMKAVLWADVFQALLMFMGIFAIIITGCLELGGIGNIFKIANDGGRLVIPSFSTDVGLRYTMWNVLLQGFILTAGTSGCGQIQVQRMLTVRSLKRARIAAFISIPMIVCFHLLCCLCGLIFYVKFRNCDPMKSPDAPIQSADQLMPYYIISTMSDFPGLPGLCICCIFSASLSTISSSINSMSSATIEDFIKPLFKDKVFTRGTLWAQALTVTYGLICLGLTFVVASIGNLVKATLVIVGFLAGPIFGIFTLGAFTTKANEMGSIIGALCSVALGGWMSFGPFGDTSDFLPVSTSGCSENQDVMNLTTTTSINMTSTSALTASETDRNTYAMSFMWISPLVWATTIAIGYASSLIIGCFTDSKAVSPDFLCPARQWFWYRNLNCLNKASKNKAENKIEKLSMELHQSKVM